MKRLITIILAAVILLTGCGKTNSSKSYTFNVNEEEQIKITLDTTDNQYDLSAEDSNFSVINEDDEAIVTGTFINEEYYDAYIEMASEYNSIPEEVDGNVYTYYTYHAETHIEHNCIIDLKDAKACIIIGSIAEEDQAIKVIKLLSFSAEEVK